jgi:hypothetical protein
MTPETWYRVFKILDGDEMLKSGTKVSFKVGRGQSIGTVRGYDAETKKLTIESANGKTFLRYAENCTKV